MLVLRTPAITAALASGDLAGAAWALCQHLSSLGVGNYLHQADGELELANYHAGHPPGRYRLIIDYPGHGIRLDPIDRREAVFLCWQVTKNPPWFYPSFTQVLPMTDPENKKA